MVALMGVQGPLGGSVRPGRGGTVPRDTIVYTTEDCVKRRFLLLGVAHMAGRRTTNRAPATLWLPSSPMEVRFSARIFPPWASMICLVIDRPNPEFCPNPWCGRSV